MGGFGLGRWCREWDECRSLFLSFNSIARGKKRELTCELEVSQSMHR